jgi:hypothetical protein
MTILFFFGVILKLDIFHTNFAHNSIIDLGSFQNSLISSFFA